ncbi:MAG: hypothetical protein IKF38_05525 [Clostridia bacterium]|nr:hypothetical protein [Clostridia bacterium]
MDKMKTYLLYIVLLILFALFTELLIAVGLNSAYKQIESNSKDIAQVEIYQEEATKVNGRIRGVIKNDEQNPIEARYLKFDFFSERGVNMGSKYIEIEKSKDMQPFEAFFKLNNVSNYKMSFVNEKDPAGEIEFIAKDLKKPEIILGTIITMLIFWG